MSRARPSRPTRKSAAPAATDEALAILHPNAAGIDIGLAEMWVSVRSDRDPEPLRAFGMNTPDLLAVATWLKACGVETVALESTGVYWIPLYEVLAEQDFEVYLVNARHAKNLPGRKTDETDAQWLRRLHTYGLLNNSFLPSEELRAVRTYMRHRAELIEQRAAHIQHMQKALHEMNLRLSPTVKDITGVTGLAIIRAILAGERDPFKLAQLRDRRCAQPEAEFVAALTGHYREEHLFALKQALALYEAYTQQLVECDHELERKFSALKPIHDRELPPLDRTDKRNTHSKNAPTYDARALLYRLLGVDLVAVDGLNEVTAQIIITEIGTDMGRWKTERHFCSWLGLAPHTAISGGRVLYSHILKTQNRAGQALRLAAQALAKSDTVYGIYFRRMRALHGPQKAIVATAHKLARAIYHMLRDHQPYQPPRADEYLEQERTREIARLEKKATKLGFKLAPATAA